MSALDSFAAASALALAALVGTRLAVFRRIIPLEAALLAGAVLAEMASRGAQANKVMLAKQRRWFAEQTQPEQTSILETLTNPEEQLTKVTTIPKKITHISSKIRNIPKSISNISTYQKHSTEYLKHSKKSGNIPKSIGDI